MDGRSEKKWGSDEEKVRKGKQVKEERGQQARKQKKSKSKGRTRGRKFGNQESVKNLRWNFGGRSPCFFLLEKAKRSVGPESQQCQKVLMMMEMSLMQLSSHPSPNGEFCKDNPT